MVERHVKLRQGVLIHEENAPVHKSVNAMTRIHELELLQHQSYPPHLAPSDLFPNTKQDVAATYFDSNYDVRTVDNLVDFCNTGIQSLQRRRQSLSAWKGIMLDYNHINVLTFRSSRPVWGSEHIIHPSYNQKLCIVDIIGTSDIIMDLNYKLMSYKAIPANVAL